MHGGRGETNHPRQTPKRRLFSDRAHLRETARPGAARATGWTQSRALMENRHGLLVDLRFAEANGRAECDAALAMLEATKLHVGPITVGADKGFDTTEFVTECRAIDVVPHVAQNVTAHRGSMIDGRTTRHRGCTLSQRIRKRVEEIFGWAKTTGDFRRTRFRGRPRPQVAAYVVGAAFNLLRMARLLPDVVPA